MSKKFYITTTIPYVNAAPHIGHALEFVEADVLSRANKLRYGDDNVYFLSGTDENAIKNVTAAEAVGMKPLEFVSQNSDLFADLLRHLNIEIDDFIRTTEERHMKGAQALWKATNPEDIYKKSYEGLYCTGCEQFYKPEELKDGKECNEHPGKELENIVEENYFFRLSNYGEWLKEAITSEEIKIIPATRRNEMLALIERGLEDFSISRPATRTGGWGVPVPGDESQTMYVWYDALANYITALGYPEKTEKYLKFWEEGGDRVHVLGKGVNRFHTIYWPAMLKSAGLALPTEALVHGYVTVDGQKMSKTIGNVIDPEEFIAEYGVDGVRFYLLHEITSQGDGDVSRDRMKESYNAHLANGLGNLAARVLKMADTNGAWPDIQPEAEVLKGELMAEILEHLDKFEIDRAMQSLWREIRALDLSIQEVQPFKLIKTDPEKAKEAIRSEVQKLWEIAVVLAPFLPQTSEKLKASILSCSLSPILFPRKA